MDLEIVVRKETKEIAQVLLHGRASIQTVGQLRGQIDALMQDGCRHILLNMKRVKFIDSAGLGSLLGARHGLLSAHGSLRLVQPSPAVARALELTQLTSAFDVHQSVHEAVAALISQRA